MSQEILYPVTTNEPPCVFHMKNMKNYEVCMIVEKNKNKGKFVMNVAHGNTKVFLILGENNSYSNGCSVLVRRLTKDESITVRFSK